MTEFKHDLKVGDKVRVTNLKEVACGTVCFAEGDITEVVDAHKSYVTLRTTRDGDDSPLAFSIREIESSVRKLDVGGDRIEELERQLQRAKADITIMQLQLNSLKHQTLETPDYEKAHRDSIALRAKDDVKRLERDMNGNDDIPLHKERLAIVRKRGHLVAEYHVNTVKGTVVARVHGKYLGTDLSKGKAQVSKEDTFNEHIGKAIALRRALGEEVPQEYMNL